MDTLKTEKNIYSEALLKLRKLCDYDYLERLGEWKERRHTPGSYTWYKKVEKIFKELEEKKLLQ